MAKTTKTPVLDELLEDVERLKEAERLLDAVFAERGPYQEGTISEATWEKVKQFYGFDDSE